ncbi:MAG TPA: ABC transporter ATP-binding protein [Allosphingosinicella sp.]|nr:ABC transporter ATP-binding protein [Allosphingosinicella sp.]
MSAAAAEAVIRVEDLRVALRRKRDGSTVRAVNGVSFAVEKGRTLGIVGESGCGKSTTAMALVRLLPKNADVGGAVHFDGRDLAHESPAALRAIRGRRIGMIFQDPMVALDPLFTVGDQLAEPLREHLDLDGEELHARQIELLQAVGISSPEARLKQYPHQMSGGMLQRIVGAIAISCNPDLLIADEPTTALDPTAQAAYLELLERLSDTYGLALIVVTHDMGVVSRICDDVMVMYAGQAAEYGPVRAIFDTPRHPYTQALLASIPHGVEHGGMLPTIEGQPPDLTALPPGCPFAPRCPKVVERCVTEAPPAVELPGGQRAYCWRADEA